MHNQIKSEIRATILSCFLGISLVMPVSGAISAAKTSEGVTSFKSTVLVSSGEIKADSLIKSEGNSRLRQELADIQIGFIPNPLGELIIDRETLQKKLGTLSLGVEMPEKVTIRRNGSILKGTDIKARIIELCQQNSPDKLEIDLSRVPNNLVLPGNASNWDLTTTSENVLGMKLFVLSADTDGGPFRQLIQIKVTRIVEAAQLARLAKPGETISAGLIRPHKVTLKSDQASVPVTFNEAIGKSLGRFKSAGTILRSSDLASENNCKTTLPVHTIASNQAGPAERASMMVKPGANVDFHVNSGNLSLKIPAKAVSGGNPGDEITLINLQNKRRIKGVVTEKGTVEYAQN
ncbi:MAG: flagella basal body P-ring formation protein FlgA, partial [Candidatus Riflebacteria bacterium]|nr:flagella basal body P-ring formation protein FlgA [Candidatus Riflebacteria bacterium]